MVEQTRKTSTSGQAELRRKRDARLVMARVFFLKVKIKIILNDKIETIMRNAFSCKYTVNYKEKTVDRKI